MGKGKLRAVAMAPVNEAPDPNSVERLPLVPRHSKAEIEVPALRRVVIAERRAAIERPTVPRAPATDVLPLDRRSLRIIDGRLRVVIRAVEIRAPLPDVAVRVVETERIRLKAGDRRGERISV